MTNILHYDTCFRYFLLMKNVPKGIIEANNTFFRVELFHFNLEPMMIDKITQAINNNPCGIPNNFTYLGSSKNHFNGDAIKSNKMYETPSKKAMILKM